jgi:uncharacterized protein YbjT (DUF2867 family)
MPRTILVVGATGRVGRGVIAALVAYNEACPDDSPFRLIALSRNPHSKAAEELSKMADVDVKYGDLDTPATVEALFENAGGQGSVWGVFCALPVPGLGENGTRVELQGQVSP